MDVTCRNKKLSTDKNRIVKAVVFVACILLTVIYGILIFNACKQREQAWNRQAKAVFLEAVGNELKKLDKMELMFIIFLYTGGITLILKMEIRMFT